MDSVRARPGQMANHPPRFEVAPAHQVTAHRAPVTLWYRPPPPSRRSIWPLILAGGVLLFLISMIATGAGIGYWMHGDRIMPGVRVMDLEIGGLPMAQATTLLQEHWQGQSILLSAGSQSWVVSPPVLGFVLDEGATMERAYLQGRTAGNIELAIRSKGRIDLEPEWAFDPDVARSYLEGLAGSINRSPSSAGIRVENGRALATPSSLGRSVNVAATLAYMKGDPAAILASGRIPLVIEPVSPAIADTGAAAEALNRLLATAVTVRAYDPVQDQTIPITMEPILWSQWLSVAILDGEHFSWSLDETELQEFLLQQMELRAPGRFLDWPATLASIQEAITGGAGEITARIYHPDRNHVVRSGETLASIGRSYGIPYPWILRANPDLDEALYEGQTLAIPSPDALLPLPVVPGKRVVVSLDQQRVYIYENGQLKWEWLASTGIRESPTAPGIFQIQSHEDNAYAGNWDLWMPYFMGVYRPVPDVDFMNGFHGFPTRNGSTLLWTGDLGHQVTYGCILISSQNAATLFNWAEEGVVVEIKS